MKYFWYFIFCKSVVRHRIFPFKSLSCFIFSNPRYKKYQSFLARLILIALTWYPTFTPKYFILTLIYFQDDPDLSSHVPKERRKSMPPNMKMPTIKVTIIIIISVIIIILIITLGDSLLSQPRPQPPGLSWVLWRQIVLRWISKVS